MFCILGFVFLFFFYTGNIINYLQPIAAMIFRTKFWKYLIYENLQIVSKKSSSDSPSIYTIEQRCRVLCEQDVDTIDIRTKFAMLEIISFNSCRFNAIRFDSIGFVWVCLVIMNIVPGPFLKWVFRSKLPHELRPSNGDLLPLRPPRYDRVVVYQSLISRTLIHFILC